MSVKFLILYLPEQNSKLITIMFAATNFTNFTATAYSALV